MSFGEKRSQKAQEVDRETGEDNLLKSIGPLTCIGQVYHFDSSIISLIASTLLYLYLRETVFAPKFSTHFLVFFIIFQYCAADIAQVKIQEILK